MLWRLFRRLAALASAATSEELLSLPPPDGSAAAKLLYRSGAPPEPDSAAKLYISVDDAPGCCGALPRGRDLCRAEPVFEAQGSALPPRPAALRAAESRMGCGVSLWHMRLGFLMCLEAGLPSPSDINSKPAIEMDRSRPPSEFIIARCSDDSTSVNACACACSGYHGVSSAVNQVFEHGRRGFQRGQSCIV